MKLKKSTKKKSRYQVHKESVVVSARIPRREYERLCERCDSAGISISLAVRKSIQGQDIHVIPGLREMAWQVSKIGSNVNQIARALNGQQFSGAAEDIRRVRDDIQEMKAGLSELCGKAV